MPLSRKKSCSACQKAKARCSRTSPCARCTSRRMECDYERRWLGGSIHNNVLSNIGHRPVFPTNVQDFNATATPLPQPTTACDKNIGIFTASSISTIDAPGSTFSHSSSETSHQPLSSEPSPQWLGDIGHAAPDYSPQPTNRTHNHNAVSTYRMGSNPESNLTYKVLLGQLLSYPQMMLTSRLPPFIYPECNKGDDECRGERGHHCLPPALANCRTIVAMFETMTVANYDFIWKTIRSEAERLKSESTTWDARELLQGLQASLIYLLLAAKFFERDKSSSVAVVARACKTLGERLHLLHDCSCTLEHIPAVSREDWIFKESIRRTICVLYGMELLLDVFSDQRDRCPGYMHVPLPSSRELWDPVSNAEWTRRYRQSTSGHAKHTDEPLRIGMVQASLMQPLTGVFKVDKEAVAEWCEGVDELGTLVWMAVLLETRQQSYAPLLL